MSEIYLSRIDLENFRTFGSFGIDLPPAPGLTLLVGTNGLGKSSFFDGLEWGLTGGIRRFADHLSSSIKEADYLTRRDAPPNSHKVSLGFSSGTTITRSAVSRPGQASVINLLKKPDWGAKIEDISTYLAFTHFLGQAAQQRFTSRDRDEQWASLKGPSGIERLEEVRRALRGRSTQAAFRKRLEEQQATIDRIDKTLSAWRDTSSRLQRLREAANATGDVSGAALDDQITLLVDRLREVLKDEYGVPEGSTSQRLVSIRGEIIRRQAELLRHQARLQGMDSVAARYIEVRASADPESAALTAARGASQSASAALAFAEQATRLAQDLVVEQMAVISKLEGKIVSLSAARQALDHLPILEQRHDAHVENLAAIDQLLAAHRYQLSQADETIEREVRQRAKLAALEAAAVAARSSFERAQELERLEGDLQAKITAAATAESDAAVARTQEPILRAERDRLQREVESAKQKIEDARRKASELAAAVARIASHLGEHDQTCPVCATAFEPGVLKQIADKAAVAQNAELAAVEAEHTGLVAQVSDVVRGLAASASLISLANSATAAAAAAREQAAALRRDLATSLALSEDTDLSTIAAHHDAAAAVALATMHGEVDTEAPAVAAARSIRMELMAQIAQLGQRRLELTQAQAELASEQRSVREGLDAAGYSRSTAAQLTSALAERNAEANAGRERLAVLETQAAGLSATETGARQRAAAAQAEQMRLTATVEAAARDAAALETQWTQAGLAGTPMIANLEEARSELARQLGDLSMLMNEQTSLAAANEAVIRHQDIAELVKWMEGEAGPGAADAPSIREGVLTVQLGEAVAARDLTKSAHTAINALSTQLKKEAEDFSTQFLMPLNDLIDDYNKALLSTPGESIRFNAAHNVDRTKFDMRLRYRDRLDEALYNTELPPQIVLSEGQLAANGFSILCAASTAYPWSTWRALLLDDPLQHNDIIHAAAFVDVMRNLVELQGYQLIMSSHDRAEGEFFARKFDAAGLPCTVVMLTAPSKEGVKFEPLRFNAAARALMSNGLARSG